jgi:hypothetical protein
MNSKSESYRKKYCKVLICKNPNCKKEFLVLKKKKGHGTFLKDIRPSNCKTCSPQCSREYNTLNQKNSAILYSDSKGRTILSTKIKYLSERRIKK